MSLDPFMIHVQDAHWEASVADCRAASEATRRSTASCRTIAYGLHPDERLDLFLPAGERPADRAWPVHLFVHGGYWRAFSKDDYSFIADAVTAAGAVAAIMDYSLMPTERIEVLVGQARRAAQWLTEHAASFGGDPAAVSASGHSAGAHLAGFLVCRGPHEGPVALPAVRAVLLVSGIYDLEPIARSFLQPDLRLTDDEVAWWSLRDAVPSGTADIALIVGSRETSPFREQAAHFADLLAESGARSRIATVPDADHMTIVRELGRPGSACAAHLVQTIRASRPATLRF